MWLQAVSECSCLNVLLRDCICLQDLAVAKSVALLFCEPAEIVARAKSEKESFTLLSLNTLDLAAVLRVDRWDVFIQQTHVAKLSK